MTTDPDFVWRHRLAGADCAYCQPPAPTHRLEVARLRISTLYLNRDQRFRGYCVLVYDGGHVTALEALPAEAYTAYGDDLRRALLALRAVVQPDHVNVECLGNRTPHLHWHLVPRFTQDARWGYPIWDGLPFEPRQVTLAEGEQIALREALRSQLAPGAQ